MERLQAAMEKARRNRNAARPKNQVEKTAEPATIKQSAEPSLFSDLPEIKISGLTARNHRITTQQNSKASAPYDMLRSRMLRLMKEHGWRSAAITSPNQGCGKTTVTVNLALSLARQKDLRILVLDLDLRRPAMQKILGHKPSHNFWEVLTGEVSAKDQLMRFGENVAFGLNNKAIRNPSELLQSRRTQAALDTLLNQYNPDIVLIDMPPMLASDDNVGFLPNVDCGLLVAAADNTTMSQLDICEKELSELTNVLGVVLNKTRYSDQSVGYDYDYY
ncbi:MAG: CpsD/CapB family tyrosine-protein kinase [Paracoccaceae bacterium]|nr:CpsD/CapB family tyrosine-protein kinase [Paracoccaceae bacterium]